MSIGTFKILSIDGGGIKGLYSAVILAEFEKKYGSIHKHFNLICGTSTGGLIALALSLGKPASEIVDFYTRYGSLIFPSSNFLVRALHFLRQMTYSSKYSNKELKRVLELLLHDARMNDAKCCLCIPAVNLNDAKGVIFKTPHCPDFIRDPELRMVDVALATSAAPTYLPSAAIDGISQVLVDGGLWANNPAYIGAIEAMSYFVGAGREYENFSILSIGNISAHKSWYPNNPGKRAAIIWVLHLFGLTISVQSNAMDNMLKIAFDKGLFPMENYIRIANPAVNPNQAKYIELDRTDKKSIELLKDLGLSTSGYWINRPEIKKLFNKEEVIEWQS